MNEAQKLDKMARQLEAESMDLQNFNESMDNSFDSDSYDTDSYDENEYGHAYTGKKQVQAKGQSTFDLSLVYTPVAMVPLPVSISLFQKLFETKFLNTTSVVTNPTSSSKRFTNAGGDYVTITGSTAAWTALESHAAVAPFKVQFIRIVTFTVEQLSNAIATNDISVFGKSSSNNISPSTFVDPNQFQLQRADFPTDHIVNDERGFTFDVNPTENIAMTLFINKVWDATKALRGGKATDAVRNLNGKGKVPQAGSARRLM